MPDWRRSMQQSYEYYLVDPKSWKDVKLIDSVKSCSISRDEDAETLGSASFEINNSVGECYIRTYLITIQNGITEKHPLGTHLVQTPSSSFDGKARSVSMDAYTPLIELKETPPPFGYSISKGSNILDNCYRLCREHARAPVVMAACDETLFSNFVANIDDKWLSFISDLLANAKYKFDLDELGRILFAPKQDIISLQPVWTYDDGNSSILHPELTLDHDLYGVPNVVEVVYSRGVDHYFSRAVNDDSNSPTSTVSRGREIVHRITDPNMIGDPTKKQIDEYARKALKELSTVEYSVSYTHGYCGTRVGDCVRINYERAGLRGVKAKIVSQTIKCEPGCPVSEKAVFTTKLWG